LHYLPVLARKPGALRNGTPFKEWELPVPIRRVWRKLERQPGGDRQMVDILSAVLTDGIDAVEAACAEALSHNGYCRKLSTFFAHVICPRCQGVGKGRLA
jgi:hypothetical protein